MNANPNCPECGAKPKVQGKEMPSYAAYLQALDDIDHPKVDKRSWYLQILGYCKKYGKKNGYAYHKFLEKFDENLY